MPLITFAKPEKEAIVQKIQQYFKDEMEQEITPFQAGFLLNFIAEEIGPHFYNKGLQDSQGMLQKRMEDITEAIDSLVKPVQTRRPGSGRGSEG